MIGIICAMVIEADGLKKMMNSPENIMYSRMNFTRGIIGNTEVCVAVCGVGKVNAAMCTQVMIDKFSPELIINSGVAGSLSPDVKIYDTVIATEVCEHDMNTSALGDPLGEISFEDGGRTFFPCDKNIIERLEKSCEGKTFKGRIASGDIFVSDRQMRKKINSRFCAVACEMEGAAVGHVCFRNDVPFGVFRVISDDTENNEGEDFVTFSKKASEISITAISSFIKS